MLNSECFTIQRKCHFTLISKIKLLVTKGTTLFIKSSVLVGKICYIGKTERCLITRITEHGTKETELMFKNLSECELFKDCCWLYSLSSLFSKDEHDDIFLTSYIFNVILQNQEVLDSNRNWSQVAFLEAHYVKNRDSIINYGLKASKEPLRFN